MRRIALILGLLLVSQLWAAEPRPQMKSAGELAWDAIPNDTPDSLQVQYALEYLEKYPNELPLLRSVQNVLNRKSELKLDFWQARMDKSPTAANRYLYARKSGEAQIMADQSKWIMANDPENFWGYYLAATAEWSREEPDLKIVTGHFEQAMSKDPSRPEAWSYGAQAYEEAQDMTNALRCYQASLVVDPTSTSPKLSILSIYAQQRDADKYFALAAEVLPKDPPLDVQLATHKSERLLTSAELTGKYTVLELFTYW